MHILNMLRKRIIFSLTDIALFIILCGVKCLFVRKSCSESEGLRRRISAQPPPPFLISNFSFRSSKNPALHKGEAGLLIIMIYYSHSMVLGGLEVMS